MQHPAAPGRHEAGPARGSDSPHLRSCYLYRRARVDLKASEILLVHRHPMIRPANEYSESLKAPLKGFYTFDESAHSPILEEPEKARRIMSEDVLAGANSLADGPRR